MVYIHNGILFGHKKEENPAICKIMNRPREHCVKWNGRERQILYYLTYMWNLKYWTIQRIDWWLPQAGSRGWWKWMKLIKRYKLSEFPLCLSGLITQVVCMRMWVWYQVLLIGLKIQHCCELWYRSQTWLWSHCAVAVVHQLCQQRSSDLTPSGETLYATAVALKSKAKQNKTKDTNS